MSSENQADLEKEVQEEEIIHYEPLSSLSFHYIVTELTKLSQSQNGMRHNDFTRYRNYCRRKIKRVRKAINMTFGKGKFQSKLFVFDKIKDSKILEIVLFTAEKNWAYALDLKTQAKDIKNKDKTHLDAQAYASSMQAQYEFELENWKNSMEFYLQSRRIYAELLKITDSFQKVLFNEKIDHIDQSLRYCNHKINGTMEFSIEEMLDLQAHSDDISLQEKIEILLDEKRKGVADSSSEFTLDYMSEKVVVKNPKVILQLQKIKEGELRLQRFKEKKEYLDNEEVFGCFIEIFSNYDEAIKLNTKDKLENTSVSGLEKIYQSINDILVLKKLSATLERNRLQLLQAEIRYKNEGVNAQLLNPSSKRALKQSGCTPFDLVRYHDNLIQVSFFAKTDHKTNIIV